MPCPPASRPVGTGVDQARCGDPEAVQQRQQLWTITRLNCGDDQSQRQAAFVADEGFESLDAPIRRVAAACVPLPFADALEQEVIPTTDKVVAAIRSLASY